MKKTVLFVALLVASGYVFAQKKTTTSAIIGNEADIKFVQPSITICKIFWNA